MESPSVDDDVDCFSPMLLNATSVNVDVYYNKAVNYTLMVTFVSFTIKCTLKMKRFHIVITLCLFGSIL